MEIIFNERIKEQRLIKGLKQSDIAKFMNVSRSTVAKWENKIQEPDYLTLALLAQYFEVSTDYLLGVED